MAASPHPPNHPPQGSAPRVTPATRQRLQALFDRAKQSFERGDCEYAHTLLSQCVSEDPANVAFVQQLRANLAKKHGAGKKSSVFGAFGAKSGKGAVAKAAAKGDWTAAFLAGCQALDKLPGDVAVLRELAAGCGALGLRDVQLYYLHWALEVDGKDVETNKQAAEALGATGQFDQAIACWQRVLAQKPGDPEAERAVARLSVEQTLQKGGYNPALLHGAGPAPDLPAMRVADLASRDRNTHHEPPPRREEAALRAALEADPDDADALVALAAHLVASGDPSEAEGLLERAAGLRPDDPDVAEAVEEAQVQGARRRAREARQAAVQKPSAEANLEASRAEAEADERELALFAGRVERSPNSAPLKFELGVRLKRAGRFREAIQAFQGARDDTRRLAETQLHLGECFQKIEQYRLAAASYEAAVAAAGDATGELRKLALYRAGVLAMGLKDLDRAEERLTQLAAVDFGYRDVADRLDRLARMRNST